MTDSFGTTTFAYDADQQLATVTDPAGGITRRTYDAAGRLASIENPAGRDHASSAGTPSTSLVVLTAANGATQAWTYDAFGRIVSFTDAGARTITYDYDADDRLVRSVDRNGRPTTYAYDKDGNLATRSYADGDARARRLGSRQPDGLAE